MPESAPAEAPVVPGKYSSPVNLLVVIAHPDDEVFASGAICLCTEAGMSATIVAITDGEGGGRELLQLSSARALAEQRRRELAASAAALGCDEPVFLAQPDVADPREGPRTWNRELVCAELVRIIRMRKFEAILTHGPRGGYGHPAHRLAFSCVMEAVAASGFAGSVYSFCGQVPGAFFTWQFDEPGGVRIDARGFAARRAASLASHRSQEDYFLRPYFPRNLRKLLSALFGYAFAFTVAGRKRVPIATHERFFKRFPVEGLVLQRAPSGGARHFFLEHFAHDHRVQIDRQSRQASGPAARGVLRPDE
jgi:LmbE family N-acetylglucosaminyl deacetylase